MISFDEGSKSLPNSNKVVIEADFEKVETSQDHNKQLIDTISANLQRIKHA